MFGSPVIEVELQDKFDREIFEKIPIFSILSVDEIWDKGRYYGTHIGSKNHSGWLAKERAAQIDKKIEAVGNRCYNYKCAPTCCPKGGMYPPLKGEKRSL